MEQLKLVRSNQLVPIEPLWLAFQQRYSPATILRADIQPRCLLPALGGWIAFDLVYKSTITVKYRQSFADAAAEVLAFLRQQVG